MTMEYPQNSVELEAILTQAEKDGDERAVMLAKFALAAAEDNERLQATTLQTVEEVRDMLDHIESWHDAGWIAEKDVKKVRDFVNGVLHGIGEPDLQMVRKTDEGITLGFKSFWAARITTHALKDSLKRPDGGFWNFIEMAFTDKEIGPLTVILQRDQGDTPKKKIARLHGALACAMPYLKGAECYFGEPYSCVDKAGNQTRSRCGACEARYQAEEALK
jgi:hypothetical protein